MVPLHKAISSAHSDDIQVSDRFHLLKNLTTYCKDYIFKTLKSKVKIEVPVVEKISEKILSEPLSIKNKKLTFKEKCEQVDNLVAQGYNKTKICRMLNMDVRTLEKIQSLDQKDRAKLFKSNSQIKHEENVAKKQEKIDQTRELSKLGYSLSAIARELVMDKRTVKNYLDPNCSPIHPFYGLKKNSILSPFYEEINIYIEKGYTSNKIEDIVRKKGFNGSNSTLRQYMSSWKHNLKNEYTNRDSGKNIEIIERKNLVKLLYRPLDKIKEISPEILEHVNTKYPEFINIVNLVRQFKQILKNKNANELDSWIETANNLKIREVNSFANGINRDFTAVKNAIIYDYNNGLAEGSVNKLKVIKRIMYGRCNFEILRTKVLRLELRR